MKINVKGNMDNIIHPQPSQFNASADVFRKQKYAPKADALDNIDSLLCKETQRLNKLYPKS